MENITDLTGATVEFAIASVRLPDPCYALKELYGGDIVRGVVLDITTDMETSSPYAVIRLADLDQPVVVPLDAIRMTDQRVRQEIGSDEATGSERKAARLSDD